MIRFPESWSTLRWPHWRSELVELLISLESEYGYAKIEDDAYEDIATLLVDDLPETEDPEKAVGGVFLSIEEYALFDRARKAILKDERQEIGRLLEQLHDQIIPKGRAQTI